MSVPPVSLVRCALALLVLQLAAACGGGSQPNPPPPPPADTTPPTTRATPAGGSFSSPITVSLLCGDGDGSGCAATHYTLDGSEPSTSSPTFQDALPIRTDGTTLKFFSVDKAGNSEAVKTERYLFDSAVLTVTASPRGGLYGAPQTVTLTCGSGPSACGSIRYTVDGAIPTASSPAYTAPLTVSASTTLRFLATDSLGNVSQVVSEVYVIDTAGPSTTASPAGGVYTTAQTVTLTCSDTGGASCAATHYTLDGSAPTRSSPVYSGPISLSATATLRFFSVDTVGNAGAAGSEQYTIDLAAPTTTASPAGGTYPGAQSVTLSCNDGTGGGCAATYYTLDGSTPTTGSSRYTTPLLVDRNLTLKFFSVDRSGNTETVRTETYAIDGATPTVSVSPIGGTYTSAQTVTLTCSDTGGSGCRALHYTLDGSTPTAGSPVYSAPLTLSATTALKFLALDGAGNSSGVRVETYIIDSGPPTTTASPAGGAYRSNQAVTLSCDDGSGSGCLETYFTVDGTTPTTGSTRYTGTAITISGDTTLKFFSVDRLGHTESVRTELYVLDRSAPTTTASPTGGTYAPSRMVTLSCGDGTGTGCLETRYTLDGSTPTMASPRYTAPLIFFTDTTLKFFSVDVAGNAEGVVTEVYFIDGMVPRVSASPAGGTYPSARTVTITCNDMGGSGCQATHYTLDGSTPTTGSPVYSAPLTISSHTVLKFLAVDRVGNVSSVQTETYVFDSAPPTVSASPAGGTYTAARTVTLSCDDGTGSGCQALHYTLDGSTPSTGSLVYSEPLTVATSTTLKFLGVDFAGNTSSVRTETYVIDGTAPTTTASPPGGTYGSAQTIALTCNDGTGTGCSATWYTVDGSAPTTGSLRYTAPIYLASNTTLRFFSVDAAGHAEAVKTEVYSITGSPSTPSAQIAAVRSAPNGALSQPINLAFITYVKPLTATDPAGFFLQAEPAGPALFVAVDPATLTPTPTVGDRVSLTVNQKDTVSNAVRATAISGYTLSGSGFPIEPLRVDVSTVDLPSSLSAYEHELITVTGLVTNNFSTSGIDHLQAPLTTTGTPPGSPSAANLRLRMPSHVHEQLDVASGCTVTVGSPLWRFTTTAQPSVWASQDITIHSCPAPRVVGASPKGSTQLIVRFDRLIDPSSVLPDGSQFTVSGGVTVGSATVMGREVHLDVFVLSLGQFYELTVASSVRDTLGATLDPSANTAFVFMASEVPAVLRITEVAPNIAGNRDLIELKVVQSGNLSGMTLVSDTFVLTFLPTVAVTAGDIIVVHFNPDTASGSDAPGSEVGSKSEYSSVIYPSNYDTAWDIHGGTSNLLYSNRVLRVKDPYGNVQDGVAFFTPDAAPATSVSYASHVRALQSEGEWAPTNCGGELCTYTSSPSVLSVSASWQGVSTDRSRTVQRATGADTDSASDWIVGPATLGAEPSAEIAAVRSAPNGPLFQPIGQALVTYVKPATGTDPAGFFLQAESEGPALFVAVDPATLTPVPMVGDRVSLTVTQKDTINGAVQATALSSFTINSRGHPVEPLRVDVSSVDLPPSVGTYEHELISVSGTLSGPFSSSGVDHLQAPLITLGTPSGSPSAANLRLRMLSHLQEQLDPGAGCNVTVQSPLWRFNATTQPSVWAAQDLSILSCPAPRVVSAAPSSATGVTVRFDRVIAPSSVLPDGSQFTLNRGLVATAAVAVGREVRLTTSSPQEPDLTYSVTVASSVRDTLGNNVDPAAVTTTFTGLRPSAVLRITEVAPIITSNRDLIELQVVQGGTVNGIALVSDTFVLATLPDVSVTSGDIIVVHLNPVGSGTDAPGSELVGKSQFPAATYPSNYDTAWDFHGGASGLLYSNRVLRVRDSYGNTQDGVAFFTSEALPTAAPSYASLVRGLQAEGHWAPTSCGGAPCTYTSAPSVLSLSASWQGCSTDRSTTVRRMGGADTHSAADWAVGASSFGIPNP
jgi:hypothetical protein